MTEQEVILNLLNTFQEDKQNIDKFDINSLERIIENIKRHQLAN